MILQGRKNPRAAFQVVDQLNNNGPGVAQRSPGLIAKTKRHFLVRGRLYASIKTQCIWPRRKRGGTFCQVVKKARPHFGWDTRLVAKDARDVGNMSECPPRSTWWVVTYLRKPLVKSVTCLRLHFHQVLDPHIHSFRLSLFFIHFQNLGFV